MTNADDVDMKNYFKLEILQTQACDLTRNLFRKRWKAFRGQDWENTAGPGNELVGGIGHEIYKRAQKIQKGDLETGDINKLDLTLLYKLLQVKEFGIGKQVEIQNIVEVRNELAHHPNKTLSQSEFDAHWATVSTAMISLGYCEDKIKELYFAEDIGGVKFLKENVINEINTNKAKKLKDESNASYRDGDIEQSIDLLNNAIRLQDLPKDLLGILYSNRSNICLRKSSTDEKYLQNAVHDAKRSIRYCPTWWKSYFRLGCVYEVKGKLEKAIDAFNKSLGLDPSQTHVRTTRDGCRFKIARQARREHLDPTQHRFGIEEACKRINAKCGSRISPELVEEVQAKLRKTEDPYLISVADVHLGEKYLIGLDGVPRDYEEAARLFAKASLAENADALYHLGKLTMEGNGVVRDMPMAIRFFERAAAQPPINKLLGVNSQSVGVSGAEHALGLSYTDGIGVDQNFGTAKYWYERGSEHGSVGSANNLALFYEQGIGGERNLERAVQYWKLAASRGSVFSMQSLENYYRNEGDLKQAKHWWKCSLENGSLTAPELEEFYTEISDDMAEASSTDANTEESLPPIVLEVFETLDDVVRKEKVVLLPIGGSSQFSGAIDIASLEKSAAEGSITARRLLKTFEHSSAASDIMSRQKDSNFEEIVELVHHMAEAYKTEEYAVRITTEHNKLLKVIVENSLTKIIKDPATDFEKNLRICYMHLRQNALQEMEEFTEESIRKFPDESHFYDNRGSVLGFLRKHEKYLAVVDEDLKIFPNHVGILFNKAGHLRLINSRQDAIEAYHDFLTFAPRDHRKVPECYYCIAVIYFELSRESGNNGIDNFKKYYKLSVDSEKFQLSCCTPYRCEIKKTLEPLYNLVIYKEDQERLGGTNQDNIVSLKEATPLTNSGVDTIRLTDPMRIQLIRDHRFIISELCHAGSAPFQFSTAPKHEQRAPKKLTGLKPITLSEMDITKDCVCEGFVLEATSIDDVITGNPSIGIILQDERGDVQRCSVYNIPQNDKHEIQKKFGFGATFSILNPYMRMASDFKPSIRIDDPASLIVHDLSEQSRKKCRFCFSDDATWTCSRCKRVKYCSKSCQAQDWSLLKHKIICKRK